MSPERWRQIEELYQAAISLSGEERAALLAQASPEVRNEVEGMLAQPAQSSLLDFEAWEIEPETPAGSSLGPGAQLGQYRIESRIGAGGMGVVYRAVDTRLHRPVAIKVLSDELADAAARRRFEREARMISALNHPNICTLHDAGRLPSGAAFMVTELIEGETLRDWLKRSPGLERGLGIIRQVIEALRAAHGAGIIHRDLKPANIMVRFDGYAKVLDFGLAKRIPGAGARNAEETATFAISLPGQIAGTVAYMSPEQILGQEVDARSDLFALGIILYEMAAALHPWPRASAVETMHAILHDNPPPLGSPDSAVERVLRRCLQKQPELRFQTVAELGSAIQEIAAEPVLKLHGEWPSIAVLPFANMSAHKENEYFGDGLAEEIINALAQMPGMLVAGRTSSFFFRDKDLDLAGIGRRLNVQHILEGSVRKAGNRIRVTAQLIKVADGFHLWSERYDREMTDIFAIQDEITTAIAAALRVSLSRESTAARRHVPDLRAYEAFLEGRRHLLVSRSSHSLERGRELLEHAIELDPGFALPRSLLGAYYTMQASAGIIAPRQAIQSARAAQQGALSLDPLLPYANALMGVCAGMEYDWPEAERYWRSALASEPVPRDVLFWYGNHYLLPIGRAQDAAEIESKVLDHDPMNLLYRRLYTTALEHIGRLKDAENELRKILEFDENPETLGMLGLICAQQGRLEEALAFTERAHAARPQLDTITGQLAALLVRTGAGERGVVLMEKLKSAPSYGVPVGMAVFHALCGDFDQAAEWARRAIEERHPLLVAKLGPLMRSSAQWPTLARLMKLPVADCPRPLER